MLTHFSTFSGIGGIDLAAEWAGFRTIGQCELADYPYAVLCKHWPGVPKWRDIKTVNAGDVKRRTGIDSPTLLSGGFPCQPFSTAGKRRGKEDDRHLWPELFRVVRELRPAWFLGENVPGIIGMELDACLADLESIGYSCRAFVVPACGVGAPHRRDRLFLLAHTNGIASGETDTPVMQIGRDSRARSDAAGGSVRQPAKETKEIVAHAAIEGERRLPVRSRRSQQTSPYAEWSRESRREIPRWSSEPGMARMVDGIPAGVDRIECLGNAVVPQQVYPFLKAIAEIESIKS